MIITIDGYAGTGKSTAAARLASELGFELLNTGAMYRAVGLLLLRQQVDIYAPQPDLNAISQAIANVHFDMPPYHVLLNGEDFTAAIRSEEAGAAASKIGTFPVVRLALQAEQRRLAVGRDMVCEGRDQGTAVFPNAEVKFFLRASLDARTDRRMIQLQQQNLTTDRDLIRQQIHDRDIQDETRAVDPLKQADDAHLIDSTELTLDDVVLHMKEIVLQCASRR